MVFAREGPGLAGDVGQQRPVIANQGLRCNRGNPIRMLEGQIHAFISLFDVVRTESRPLQVFPVNLELLTALVDAVAQGPIVPVGPRGVRRHSPRAKSAPVV
ncbi:MAG: hypothetical protein ACYS9C_17820, partial [Planctomycetota bacterium]